jgi:hypothetical protein
MPITGSGWEFLVTRQSVQRRQSDGKKRTVGTYQVFHDGAAQSHADLRGSVAESKGPGANAPTGNGRRIEAGRYPVSTHIGSRYRTLGFDPESTPGSHKKPALLFLNTDQRTGILIHPGVNFLSSIGCLNPCGSLPDEAEMIDWHSSMRRIMKIISDIKAFIGSGFPATNGVKIPGAHFVIDGEP